MKGNVITRCATDFSLLALIADYRSTITGGLFRELGLININNQLIGNNAGIIITMRKLFEMATDGATLHVVS